MCVCVCVLGGGSGFQIYDGLGALAAVMLPVMIPKMIGRFRKPSKSSCEIPNVNGTSK
jgi:hypothetical protein